MDKPGTTTLPPNAYRELKPGETYEPFVPATQSPPETTARAIVWGLLFCLVFTVASVYSGMKVGQVMEAAIPISILAIGVARFYKRRSTVVENVIVQSIGGASGVVTAGAIFTIPALYMLGLSPSPVETSLVCLLGGSVGILFLIPLRRYFVATMHGRFPYPEATAITEVLVTGEKGGDQARVLVKSMLIGGVFDFIATTLHVWKEMVDFLFVPGAKAMADRARIVVKFNAEAFILGLGYVMGLRSSAILCAGGFAANFVFVPVIYWIGSGLDCPLYPGKVPISAMSAGMIFKEYVRLIGVGAIATAGIIAIAKSVPIIVGSFSTAFRGLRARAGGAGAASVRTDLDIGMGRVLLLIVGCVLGFLVVLWTLGAGIAAVLVGLLVAVGLAFLFTSVAANAIAATARNPISGMTMLAIIVSSVVLLRFGLSGTSGMYFIMMVAAFFCTATASAGGFVTDLKTGYWLGSTPRSQERWKFLGVAVAAVAAAVTMAILAKVFTFGDPEKGLAAPQAAIMKELVKTFMSNAPVAWGLFGMGAMLTVCIEMLGIPSLIFALGMYLPLELNTPALAGGLINHWVTRKADRQGEERSASVRERGIVIASGFMAGGAIGGVIGAALRLVPGWGADGPVEVPWWNNDWISQGSSIVLFVGLCMYLYFDALRARRGPPREAPAGA